MTSSGDAVVTAAAPRRRRGASTARWAIGSAIVAALVVGSGVLSPLAPLALVGGSAVLAFAAFKPKAFAVFALIVILLSVPIQNAVGSGASYADEAMVALATLVFSIRRFVTRGRLVWLPGSLWFVGFVVMGVASAVVQHVPLTIAGPGAFIAVKALLFAFATAQLEWTADDLRVAVRFGVGAIVVLALSGLLNLVDPVPWAKLTTGHSPDGYVHGIPALNGPFQHPAAFSRINAVMAIAVLAYGLVVRRSKGNVVLLVVSGGLAFLTFEVKSILAMIVCLGGIGARFLRPVGIAGLICLGPLILGLVAPSLGTLIGGDVKLYIFTDSARLALAYGSVLVANRYFPLGAGFGRYGSATAASNYSPEYYTLGFNHIFGLGPADGGPFLNDNQWPAIIGETGYIGAVLLAVGIVVAVVSLLRRVAPDEQPLVRWIRITGIAWTVALLIESAAAPVFVSAPSYPFLLAAVGVVASLRESARRAAGQPGVVPQARVLQRR